VIVATYGLQVTISLLVLGYFLVAVLTINRFTVELRRMVEIHAFLDENLSANDYPRIQNEIKAIDGVVESKYISAEQALENFMATTKIDLGSLLEDNPLPDSYIVKTESIELVPRIAEQVRRVQGVAEVRFGQDIVIKLSRILFIVQLVSTVTILLLLGASFSSINNIVRLSIHSRRREIRIMQLVGATKWFIRWPFLLEGLFIGVLGSFVAALLVWASYVGLTGLFEGMKIFQGVFGYDSNMIFLVTLSLIFIGATVGITSSFNALSRYLAEDERMIAETARIRRELEWR